MDVDLNSQTPRPTRDASGNAIWRLSVVHADIPSGSPTRVAVIRFRHIALFLLGSGFLGVIFALLTGLSTYGLTHSKFVAAAVGGIVFYAALIVGYHWTSQERDWT